MSDPFKINGFDFGQAVGHHGNVLVKMVFETENTKSTMWLSPNVCDDLAERLKFEARFAREKEARK